MVEHVREHQLTNYTICENIQVAQAQFWKTNQLAVIEVQWVLAETQVTPLPVPSRNLQMDIIFSEPIPWEIP